MIGRPTAISHNFLAVTFSFRSVVYTAVGASGNTRGVGIVGQSEATNESSHTKSSHTIGHENKRLHWLSARLA